LWNKPASGATYTTYDSTTIDGDVLAVGSVSIACLSCHDGTQAMDTVINAPGSGGHNPLGTSMAAGPAITNTVVNLTADLRDDHPIGVQYGGYEPGGIGTGKVDPDFKGDGEGLQVAVINLKNRWWVDTEVAANGTREKTDMILYTRDNGGSDEPFVECASCHDPHDDSNDTFLRISNESSDVCLACHVK
jgi:predicted CXXCH cytochrome family protein